MDIFFISRYNSEPTGSSLLCLQTNAVIIQTYPTYIISTYHLRVSLKHHNVETRYRNDTEKSLLKKCFEIIREQPFKLFVVECEC